MSENAGNESVFDGLVDALGAVRELLKVQLALEEASANNAAGAWEDIASFVDDIVQRVVMRILKAIVFAVRVLVVRATPDFTTLPLGSGILDAFPVLARFFGESARIGTNMLEMFNNKIKQMETRNLAGFVAGNKLLASINKMNSLAAAINFIGELIGATDEVHVDAEGLQSRVADISQEYAEQSRVNTLATDPGSLTSTEVTAIMGSVSYTESILAKSESSFRSSEQPGLVFYGPDGRSLTPSGTVNIDRTRLPGYDPEQEKMWEDLISMHENMAGQTQTLGFADEYTAQFWYDKGYRNAEDVINDFGPDALGPHTFEHALRRGGDRDGGDTSISDSPDTPDLEDRNTEDPYMDDPEGDIGSIIDQLMTNLGDFVGDIVSAVDAEEVSGELADELEESDSQAKEARKNQKVVRIIESLKS